MNIIVWFILLSAAGHNPAADARRLIRKIPPKNSRAERLSNKEIVKALSRLLSDTTEPEDLFTAEETDTLIEQGREARQFPGFSNPRGNFEITGYETNIREECTEVSNVECKKINVTMYRPEITQRCKTSFDQTCNVTYKDVPTDKCSPTKRNR